MQTNEVEQIEEVAVKPTQTTAKKTTKKAQKQLKITLVKSACSSKPNQRKTVEALGLTKIRQSKVQPDNDAIRGMIFTVKHLVEVEEI